LEGKALAEALKKAVKDGNESEVEKLKAQVAKRDKPTPPKRKRYLVNDTTVEKLGELMADNPNGLLLFRDELRGFLKSFERKGHEGDRAFYLEAWDGNGQFTYDRISRGTVEIDNMCIALLGAIQPNVLQAYVADTVQGGAGDDGLLQRFQLMVWPEVSMQWHYVDTLPCLRSKAEIRKITQCFANLDKEGAYKAIGATKAGEEDVPHLRFSDKAQEAFVAWLTQHENELRQNTNLSPALVSHFTKYRSLVPALALILHLTNEGTGSVSLEALNNAVAIQGYLRTHAQRVYGMGQQGQYHEAKALLQKLKEGKLNQPFTQRDVYRHEWAYLKTPHDADVALGVLVAHHVLAETPIHSGGRPTCHYTINPALQQG
jgi:hypothetical protein